MPEIGKTLEVNEITHTATGRMEIKMDKAKNIEEVIKKLTTITRQAKIHGGVSVLHNLIKEENTEEVFVLLEDALKVIYRLELKNKMLSAEQS